MEYVGSAIACSAASLVLDSAIVSASENRELTYGEAYATVGNCFVPIIGGLIGQAIGDEIHPCKTPEAIQYFTAPEDEPDGVHNAKWAQDQKQAYLAKNCATKSKRSVRRHRTTRR